jgi:hypothetical protein
MKKEIKGYEGLYSVDEKGRIYGKKGFEINPYDNGYGYMVIDLRDKSGTKKHKRVHRLVAEAFIPNPYNLPEVNHKDENKQNNSADNLEWCTSSYNKKYGTGSKRRSDGMKKVWRERRADNV